MKPTAETTRWMPIFSRYEVSDHGNVRSFTRWKSGRPLAIGIDKDGYRKVTLVPAPNGPPATLRVSVLVLTAFVGPRPTHGALRWEAAHNDGNNKNDTLGNLCWKTSKENGADKIRHGTPARGERNGSAALSKAQVLEIKKALALGEPQRRIAERHGVGKSTVGRIHRRRNWTHVEIAGPYSTPSGSLEE